MTNEVADYTLAEEIEILEKQEQLAKRNAKDAIDHWRQTQMKLARRVLQRTGVDITQSYGAQDDVYGFDCDGFETQDFPIEH